MINSQRLPFSQRAQLCQNPLAQQLFLLMEHKKTNLSVSLDVTTKRELLRLADQLGPEICVLKTHIDIIEDFDQDLINTLQRLAAQHQFFLFEDRKFTDIGNTVRHQYAKGIYRIAEWAHIVNALAISGPGIVAGLKEVGMPKQRGLLLLAEMSSAGNLAHGAYTQACIELAEKNPDFIIGFVAQKRLMNNPSYIYLTPGVQLTQQHDALGQQYLTPEYVIAEQGSDIIIVGRGIYMADNPIAAAKTYRELAWQAYQKSVALMK